MRYTITTLLLLPLGCSDFKMSTMDGGVSDTASEPDYADDSTADTAANDTGLFIEPDWWSLSADFVLSKGVPLIKESRITVFLTDEESGLLCEQSLPILAVEEVSHSREPLLTWWQITPEWLATLCGVYPTPLTETILLGVGEMNLDVLAATEAIADIDGSAPLNGAYMGSVTDSNTIYVYGVSGTPAAFDGVGEAATEAPLEDGLWLLKPVYHFTY